MNEPNTKTITLDTPLMLGEKEITSLQVRQPMGGDLRGLKLGLVIESDVDTLATLVPRISDPMISSQHVYQMPLHDLVTVGNTVAGFFLSPSALKQLSNPSGQTSTSSSAADGHPAS